MARPLPEWPTLAEVAVCLIFDVDAESGVLGDGDDLRRLSRLSEARFGVVRGVPRTATHPHAASAATSSSSFRPARSTFLETFNGAARPTCSHSSRTEADA